MNDRKRVGRWITVGIVWILMGCLLIACAPQAGVDPTAQHTDPTQTVSTGPTQAKPTEPEPAESEPTQPKPTESEPTQPKPTEPKPTEPKPTEPKPTEPKPTEPKPTQPKPTEPKPTQPKPTEPKPTEPKPTEPKPTEPKPTQPAKGGSCTVTIRCDTILSHWEELEPGKEEFVPEDGVILQEITVKFSPEETVFDVLKRVCKDNGIPLEYSYSPSFGSYYVERIHNLGEFDCGSESGWVYLVNGANPNYSCSEYVLQDGDEIAWLYTCEGYGADVGGSVW